jgi:glycosyltransferase involved in cell wall biosynthesis
MTTRLSLRGRASVAATAARRWLQDRGEVPSNARVLQALRGGRDVCWSEQDAIEPLVTVRIATRDRPKLLIERAVASAIRQTYSHLEILVVGDDAGPETVSAIAEVRDPRVRFVNLPPTPYPADSEKRWMVIGYGPMNHALDVARGAWITPLDDDDEFTPDHVEVLLREAVARRLEFVYGDTAVLRRDGTWGVLGSWPPRHGGLTHGAVLYSSALRFMKYDPQSWRLKEPADWNLWRRMLRAGVRMGYVPATVYRYYPAARVPTA